VDLGRQTVAARQEFGEDGVRRLAAAAELGHPHAHRLHAVQRPENALFHAVEELGQRDGHAEKELAAVDVMNHVHDLEDPTGVPLRRPRLAGQQEEVAEDRRVRGPPVAACRPKFRVK
jgi:hypothetical protein